MKTELANQYRLLVKREPDGTEKQAVEVRLEVPDGFCWQDLGHQMLRFGMRYIADHSTNSDETSRIPLWNKVFPKTNQEI